MKTDIPLMSPPEGWIIEYPEFDKLADEQVHAFWPWDEPEVENDIQDIRVYMTDSEQHGTIEVLRSFTKYEMHAGDDYWAGRIMSRFKRPEIQRMASMFSAVELNSHAPFYNRINELLYLDNEEFYGEWKQSKVLRDRMAFIGRVINDPDDLISTAGFAFIEGAVLYTQFAYLKHFQAQECGKNLIRNICSGIALSVGDENTHAVGSSMLANTIRRERELTDQEYADYQDLVHELALVVYEHEEEIIRRVMPHDDIGGITVRSMQDFAKHRINLVLEMLQLEPVFDNELLDGKIATWFYADINSISFHDFFVSNGSEYHIDWSETAFGSVWPTPEEAEITEQQREVA